MDAFAHPHFKHTSRAASRGDKVIVACGLALAASALAVRWTTRQAERTHKPQGTFLIIDGKRLH